MNCHGDQGNNGKKSHLSHMLMMLLCCGAPIIVLALVSYLSSTGNMALAKPLSAIVPFLCPIMMILMLPMMFKGKKEKD